MKYFKVLSLSICLGLIQSCMFQATSNLSDRDDKASENIFDTSNVLLQNGCACQNSRSLSSNSECTTFCSSKNHSDQILYFDVLMNPQVYSNSETQNLYDWCTKERRDASGTLGTNPSCYMEIEDPEGFTTQQDIVINRGIDKLSLDISALDFGKTYRLTLTQLPSNETSDNVQFIKLHPLDNSNLGNIKISAVNYYECENYLITENTEEIFFSFRTTFYFSINTPSYIPAGNPQIKCHEGDASEPDDPSKPRLALDLGQFSVWSLADPRLFDNDGDQKIDLQNIIESKTGLKDLPPIFSPYTHATDPINVNGDPALGFFMIPWLNEDNFESFCLGNDDYQSDNLLFRELGNYLSVETEAIYRANVRTPSISVPNPETQEQIPVNLTTFVDVSETMLKKMWFTYDNVGNEVPLTEETVKGKDIFFWWPYDPALESMNPRPDISIRQQSQTLFQVMDLNQGSGASAHDKRFGCIPKR